MEGRGREGVQLSSTNPTKPAGTLALRNFTIPRKKRVSGQVLLEPCPEESRDYSLIQSKLREARLDMRKEHANAWLWKDVKLVHNEEFLKEFSEKRSEMRTKGRHGREMEERFCFLAGSHEMTTQIYQLGLRTETQEQYSLGKPSHGVYLFRHVDVALKHAATSTLSGKNLIVFKVLFGKVKKVTPSLDWNRTPDPMVAFDCHMSKDAVSHRESLSQQVLGSSVFLFDYNENQELNKRPRQCLPYAVVSFVPAINATPPTSISPPASPVKHPTNLSHGPLERLRGCTVAKRRGKGENATVTFKHFATQGCPGPDYTSPTHGVDPPIQYNELQNPLLFFPSQLYMPLFHTAGYFSPSLPYVDSIPFQNSVPFQNYPDESTFPPTTSVYGGNTENSGVTPQTSTEKISTIVYSSRLVKDPRLSRQETNTEKKSSEQETESSVSECDEQPHPQNKERKNEFTRTVSCEKQSLDMAEEQSGGCCLKLPQDDLPEPDSNPRPTTENMPSIKLFKMKFQKYAAYLRMSEEGRHKVIWSKEDLTPEQKRSLIDRVHFYEVYYQKYKQGLLFQKDTETENVLGLSNMEPKNNETCLSTLNKSPLISQDSTVRHSISSEVSNLTPTTDLLITESPKVDVFNTANEKVLHNGTESTAKTLKEKGYPPDCPEYLAEPPDGSVVQSEGEPSASEQSLEHGALLLNTSQKREAIESAADFEQPLCPSCPSEQVNVNPQDVSERKSSTIPSESTLSNNMEENPEFHNITAMDVANCVDISESNDLPSATGMGPDQNSQRSTKNEDREPLTHSESGDSSEMSIEVKRGELRQDNTIHSALYKRLQLGQLLPNLNGANTFSNKSYLRPKDLDKIPCIGQLYGHLNETVLKEDSNKAEIQNQECGDLQHIVMKRSNQVSATTERLTLSERFSQLRGLQKKLAVCVHKKPNSNTVYSAGDVKSNPEGLSSSSDGEKETESKNIKLIQLLAQRFNETRSLANCRHLRRKRSKVLSRRKATSSVWSLKHSSQSPAHFLRRALHLRKRHLRKAMKKRKTKLVSQHHILSSKSTLNPSTCAPHTTETPDNYEVSDSHLNSGAASQSSGPQSHNQLETSQDTITSVSTEDHSCLNTSVGENKSSHDNEFVHISQSKEQPTEVCETLSRISSNCDIKKSQGDIPLDIKEPERGTNNSSICHQEKSSPVTCPGDNESNNDGEIAKEKHKEEAASQKNLPQANAKEVGKEKCDTEEISTDYNAGAYEDKSNPVQAVSSIPNDITSGNTITACTAKARTAMTPDLPRLMNNDEADRETVTETQTLYDSAVDSARSGVIKSVVDLTTNVSSTRKTRAMEANGNIQNSDPCSLANRTDANAELFSRAETSVKSAKNDFISCHDNTDHPSEPASRSKPLVKHTKSSGIINSHVETTADLHNKVIRDAKEAGIVAMTGNLHSAWQGQDKNNLPSTSTETQLISKLRDYLTKFECTVKRQESVNVNDPVKDGQVPMAWITLDSTVHKQQLFDARHYNRLDLANLRHQRSDLFSNKKDHSTNYMLPSITNEEVTGRANVQDETANVSVALTKRKGCNQPKSYTPKRTRRSKLTRVSPDSTSMLETAQRDSPSLLVVNKDPDQSQISTSITTMQQWMQNHGNAVHQNQIAHSQSSENLHGSSPQQSQVKQSAEKATKVNKQTLYDKKVHTCIQKEYSVTDISSTLKLADHAVSVAELSSLQLKCKAMLQHFVLNFERDHKVFFNESCISRNLILEKYLDHPPVPVELKFEGLNSFLELQMMLEASQFVENKMNFLSRKPTFRSLLWYDPSLYGELYKGAVGFQQQSSLFSSFQQCLGSEGYSKLQEYYAAVSTLHQQLQDAPDTSYYMYLKSKRERLEIEAALRNPPDIKSFFLSVPVALMMNFGDSLESLEKAHSIVMTFVETPSDRLPGTFDVGKAEHLSIICRYLQEKVIFMKSHEEISKVSWFGLEHLLYDASKLLVWRESEHGISNEVLRQYKRSNPQIVYGVTEAGVALVNKMEQPVETARIAAQQQIDGVRNYRSIQPGISTERTQSALDLQTEDGVKETYQPARRRASHPPLGYNLNDGGVTPHIQPILPAQLGKSSPFTAFPQQSSAVHWKMPGTAWDWNPPGVGQTSKSHPEIRALLLSKRRATVPCAEPRTDIQNSHAVRQQQWPSPFMVNPRAVERISHQPTTGASHHAEHRKEQASDANVPLLQPYSFPTSSVVPPPLSLLPFSNTSNQVPPHEISTPINYPYFLFNGRTYSTAAPSVPLPGPALHTEARYHPHPV
ncbi:uncharacterized protein LOC118824667 [Colossoma macropomum]|uniref:uncharacterized protein LOC118824667 n=1 Tax=Colossoma macropomum TaxID=42526 RepID=UPI0018648920|nr:uncharacterized protein LOC118824667 [Colossoma macropomum]XP_036450870.1 uncharacterized protein LOC118824667 [Colossoma macropomum]XP_036450871.1 uncharacterized protein LOC118824667 [Colossoma macropomum]XP_036450872.1 uncharacterized protein LOC118824667 [Colossoma macropomum]